MAPFTVHRTANCMVLKLCNPLDIPTLGLVKMLLDATASTAWPTRVVIELTDCPSADITGLTVLSVLQHESQNLTVVLPAQHPFTRLLSAMHIDTFLTVTESLDIALEETGFISDRSLPNEVHVAKAPRVSHGLLVDPSRMKTYRRYKKSWPDA